MSELDRPTVPVWYWVIAILLTQHFPFTEHPLREDLKAAVYQALVEARDVD